MVNSYYLKPSGLKPCFKDYAEYDESVKIIDKVKNLKIKYQKKTVLHSIVEIEGLDISFANALRRILLTEVPTLAIETVQIYQNTGVIQDELLCHRLGLIPFAVNPDLFCFKNCEEMNDKNSLCFSLVVKCETDFYKRKKELSVYSGDLQWIPLSSTQAAYFKNNPPKPVYDDILITRLAPGQEIDLVAYLEKGIGKVHAKWSPVATAYYKFMPSITVNKSPPLTNSEKKNLVNICPMNVFSLKNNEVCVENPLDCTSCRMCLETYPNHVTISKFVNHILFSIESSGSVPSYYLLEKAVEVLKEKTLKLKTKLLDAL